MIQIATEPPQRPEPELSTYSIVSKLEQGLNNSGECEPEDFVDEITTTILFHASDGSEHRVGFAVCRRINIIDSAYTNYAKFDSVDEELVEYYRTLFDSKTDEPRKGLSPIFEDFDQVFIIERMGLLPEHRGLGVGGMVTDRLIYSFASDEALVVACPLPLNRDSGDGSRRMRSHKNRNPESAIASLQAYTRTLGFRQYQTSWYFVREKGEIYQG